MLSENFDKKIKQTLDERTPGFNEASWEVMEKLLDKQLPQKKDDRRRLIIFLSLFLLLGGGITVWLTGIFSAKEHKIASIPTFRIETPETEKKSEFKTDQKKIRIENSGNHEPGITQNPEPIRKISVSENKPGPLQKKIITKTSSQTADILMKKQPTKKAAITRQSKPVEQKNGSVTNPDLADKLINDQQQSNTITETPTRKEELETKQLANNESQQINPEQKKDVQPELNQPTEKKDAIQHPEITKVNSSGKKSLLNRFVFSVSAGPDMSTVGLNNTGKIKPTYGAGLGYRLTDRFTIRSGFYVGRKIYTAAPEDYNPPANFWNYYPNLKHIEANCKVYEWPVNLDYNFGNAKKQTWFVSAGVSSLFMKKEVYNYYFKPNNSQQYIYYSRSYENKNKHYFSILNLSGGFARKISSHFVIQAEPYLKVAMNGVGYGKVKLNSTGVLFTTIVQPFNKAGKKDKK